MPLDTMIQGNLGRYDKEKAAFEAPTAGAGQVLADLPQPTGPTAASVNQAAAQKQPSTWAEFTGRGGLQNTAQSTVNKIKAKLEGKKLMSQYTNLLAEGEAGANALYRDASVAIGEEVNRYVPQRGMSEWGSDKEKVSFYDDNGIFLPHKYAQAVALGVLKWQADQKQKSDRMQAGTIIGGAATPQVATAGILGAGQDVTPYEKPIGTIRTPEQIAKESADAANTQAGAEGAALKNEWYPTLTQSEINKNNSAASKDRGGSERRLRGQDIAPLRAKRAELERTIESKRKSLRDPVLSAGLTASEKEEANNEINDLRVQQQQIDQEIDMARKNEGMPAIPPPDPAASAEAIEAAQSIIDGMNTMPPKGMLPKTDEIGSPAYSKDKWIGADGKPDAAAYNSELSNRVYKYLGTKGITKIQPGIIAELIKNNKLEDVINDILVSTKAASSTPAQQPEQPPAAGTLQSVRY